MGRLRMMWRDVDRLPYLYVLRHAATAYDLELKLERPEGREYAELLAKGSAEVLLENYWNLQVQRSEGTPLVSIGAAVNTINEKVLAKPDIGDVQHLRGKRVAIRGQHPTDFIDLLWLKDNGLLDEVEVVQISDSDLGRWSQWRAVTEGDCHAAITTNIFADAGVEAGLRPLSMGRYGFLGNVVFTTSPDIRDARRADMEDLLRAAFDAARLFQEAPDKVKEILATIPDDQSRGLGNPKRVDRAYELFRDELAHQPIPSPDAIDNFHRMLLPEYPALESFNPLIMWDLTIAGKVWSERRAG